MGTRQEETGRLNVIGGDWALRRDGGGTWRLDLGLRAWWRARHLAGRRVRVTGRRIGFDLLAVDRIVADEERARSRPAN